jgi:hypothetical protein
VDYRDLIGEAWDDWLPHVIESLENGDFEMNEQRLPWFEENSAIPDNYGIEHSHDGGFYPYRYDASDRCHYLKDKRGLDLRCRSREEALQAIREEV